MPLSVHPACLRRAPVLALLAWLLAGGGLAVPAAQTVFDAAARTARIAELARELRSGNPWPAIRRERIRTLLPAAMDAAGVDAWVVFCREDNNDPLAKHVGGENAGRPTIFLFLRTAGGVNSVVIAPPTEAVALAETLSDATVVAMPDRDPFAVLADEIRRVQPRTIAVNRSELAVADGLSAMQEARLKGALGPDLSALLRSSEELVVRWLGVKLPAEIAIMRRAAVLTDLLEYEAFDLVVPGKTTNGDMQRQMRARVAELGFGHAWIDNPGIQSGLDRGRGSDARRTIVEGDVINIDFGIKVYDTWCTDLQRFAYVLRPGETGAPQEVAYAWESASGSSRRMQAGMRPGMAGWDVDRIQVDWMRQRRSLPHWANTGHAVGYWAHDVGPIIGGFTRKPAARGNENRTLQAGMVFAFDGNFVWPAEDAGVKGTRSITSEEMAAVNATGAEYLSPVQQRLVLIPGRPSAK